MSLFTRVLLSGIWVSLLTISAMGKGPKPSYDNAVITGDIVSVILDVNDQGEIIVISEGAAEITMGVGVRGWTEVELWLSADLLEINGALLYSHAYGEDPFWLSGEDPPLWIGGEFLPSPLLGPDEGGTGRYYFGNARLMKGENDSRFDFDFSPHGPCTSPAFGERVPPVSANPEVWADWRENGPADSPPVCPFMLVLLGGQEDSNGNVTFDATDELFLVRNGGYPRVMLADFTLGPLCPEENSKPGKGKKNPSPPPDIPDGGCVKPGGYDVGTGPIGAEIVFDFSQN